MGRIYSSTNKIRFTNISETYKVNRNVNLTGLEDVNLIVNTPQAPAEGANA